METTSIRAPESATPFTNKDDAAILAAWERNKAARAIYDALPLEQAPGRSYTPDEQAHIDIMDEAEEVICSTKAITLAGVEVQLWLALGHQITGNEESAAAIRGDIAWFDEHETKIDWVERITLAAIRSVHSMQAEQVAFVEAWLAAWTKDGGSVVIDDDGKAQVGWPVYDLSPNYRAPDAAWAQEVRDNAFLHGQASHDATMKARYEALRMFPGGVDALKAYMRAKGTRVALHTMEQGK